MQKPYISAVAETANNLLSLLYKWQIDILDVKRLGIQKKSTQVVWQIGKVCGVSTQPTVAVPPTLRVERLGSKRKLGHKK